jgi:predicted nuclease with TOPRIM domain
MFGWVKEKNFNKLYMTCGLIEEERDNLKEEVAKLKAKIARLEEENHSQNARLLGELFGPLNN